MPAPSFEPILIDTNHIQEASRSRRITTGALKDRIGAIKTMAIATSTHPVCIGVREMISGRDYIDLDRPDVRDLLMLLVAVSQPEAVPYFPGSGPLTEQEVDLIVGAPVRDVERP